MGALDSSDCMFKTQSRIMLSDVVVQVCLSTIVYVSYKLSVSGVHETTLTNC